MSRGDERLRQLERVARASGTWDDILAWQKALYRAGGDRYESVEVQRGAANAFFGNDQFQQWEENRGIGAGYEGPSEMEALLQIEMAFDEGPDGRHFGYDVGKALIAGVNFISKVEKCNDVPSIYVLIDTVRHYLGYQLWEDDARVGYLLAMQAMGHGISVFDGVPQKVKLPLSLPDATYNHNVLSMSECRKRG